MDGDIMFNEGFIICDKDTKQQILKQQKALTQRKQYMYLSLVELNKAKEINSILISACKSIFK